MWSRKAKIQIQINVSYNILTVQKICTKWFSWKKIKRCRKASEEYLKFKEKLGLDPYKITCDEQVTMSALQVAFEGEIIHIQYCIENKRLDA